MHEFRSINFVQHIKLVRCVDFARVGFALLACSCLCSGRAAAQRDLSFEPYSVFVAQAEAFARCGPSGDYYRTDALRHGQSLDVYAETDDGWLGIRPPEDSFCWIPADSVTIDDDAETGVISEDRTVAWIGTHLGRARKYRWQVQLAEGESVTVLGKSERDGPDGPQLWFRIVPPSGEYRWIHRDQVVQTSEELIATIQPSTQEIYPGELGPTRVNRDSSVARSPRPTPENESRGKRSQARSSVVASGQSILSRPPTAAPGDVTATNQPQDRWQTNETRASSNAQASTTQATSAIQAMKQGGLLASIEFLGRPRLLEIGDRPSAPATDEQPADSNWIAGAVRPAMATTPTAALPTQLQSSLPVAAPLGFGSNHHIAATPVGSSALLGRPVGAIMQASAIQPITPRHSSAAMPNTPITKIVSAQRIAEIEAQTQGADVDQLSLIFSRLMASRAAAVEVDPITRAARTLATSSVDAVDGGRARLLAERAEQYSRVANRRDGDSVIQSLSAPTIPGNLVAATPLATPANQTLLNNAAPPASPGAIEGYLVQVYSSRTNSPPFALTDNTGRTVAYVTPIPGVNLRTHLNSKVVVSGSPGYLTGLNTPHIMATQAVRTPE